MYCIRKAGHRVNGLNFGFQSRIFSFLLKNAMLGHTCLQVTEIARSVQLTVLVIEMDWLSVLATLATTEHLEKRTYLADVSFILTISTVDWVFQITSGMKNVL